MARKSVTYKEPASYFNDDMKKAAKDWENSQKGKKKTADKAEKKTATKTATKTVNKK